MQSSHFVFEAIGTKWVIDIEDQLLPKSKTEILKDVSTRINLFDKTYSRFRKDSLVTKMSKTAGEYMLPEDAKSMLTLYEKLYFLTKGLVTPLIGSVLEEAGYDASYSLRPGVLHTPQKWEEALSYNFPKLMVKKPALLDFGALGKGHIIDIVGTLLSERRVFSYCIDAGGDMLYKSSIGKKLSVGLEHPGNQKQVIGVATITNKSICASAGNRRKWDRFHHIINPYTLSSPMHILAVWVIAETAILADALSTCLFFVDPKILKKYFTFQYLLLFPDYTIDKSPDFPAKLYYNQ